MHFLVSGSSGFIGSALVPFLAGEGHRVTRLIRSQPKAGESAVRWDPQGGMVDAGGLNGLDGVVHLAGESAVGRWTDEKKLRIRDSRVKGTHLLCESLARLAEPPKTIVCASAIGYYGDRGEEILTEESPPGSNFLAEVCREWEAACRSAVQKGIRVVNVRIGLVLSREGGALAKMLTPFRLGLGGTLGNGKQYMSWITLDDLLGIFSHVLMTESLRGPVNAVAPKPVTNAEFTRTLGKILKRPTPFPMPAFAARVAFGEMANELLLAGTRVEPTQLLATGYRFRHPELESALRFVLGK